MQGNGSFCTHEPQFNHPIKLHLVSTTERVNLIATLSDLQVCIACFHAGMYDPQVIPTNKATQMGIRIDHHGHILNAYNIGP